MTDASTLAGENVLGSFNKDITDSKIVRTFCVGFHLSQGNSPLETLTRQQTSINKFTTVHIHLPDILT
jgi:hypothetical protein